jgi:hypothetical protein
MEMSRNLNPGALPTGTEVGQWRVVSLSGRGTWGTVYRAEKIGHEHEGPVALKMAVQPLDPRYEREGELLGRMRHPSVPGLLDRGWWRGTGGTPYPFLVMPWIEGLPLYAWASQPGRTWGEAVRVLKQVASALAATHAVDGVHRDVKGENVWVREDGTAVLLDFGSGYHLEARTLTRPGEEPGTPQYWSPESLRFQWEHRRERTAHYRAGAADDVYALGMLAWRLMAGRYPEPAPEPEDLGEGTWLSQPVLLPPQALALAGRELKALILRMLSSEPGARCSAAEVEQALEQALAKAGRKAERSLVSSPAPASSVKAAWAVALEWARERRRGLVVVAAAVLLAALGVWRVAPSEPREEEAHASPGEEGKDAGTSELADTAVTEDESEGDGEWRRGGINLEVPKEPLSGQIRPPCKPPTVAINNGCWVHFAGEKPPCNDRAYEWSRGCYWPLLSTSRLPTSEPR